MRICVLLLSEFHEVKRRAQHPHVYAVEAPRYELRQSGGTIRRTQDEATNHTHMTSSTDDSNMINAAQTAVAQTTLLRTVRNLFCDGISRVGCESSSLSRARTFGKVRELTGPTRAMQPVPLLRLRAKRRERSTPHTTAGTEADRSTTRVRRRYPLSLSPSPSSAWQSLASALGRGKTPRS